MTDDVPDNRLKGVVFVSLVSGISQAASCLGLGKEEKEPQKRDSASREKTILNLRWRQAKDLDKKNSLT